MELHSPALQGNKISQQIQEIINARDGLVVVAIDNPNAYTEFTSYIAPQLLMQFEDHFLMGDGPGCWPQTYFMTLEFLRLDPDMLVFKKDVLDDRHLHVILKMFGFMKIIMIVKSINSGNDLQNRIFANSQRTFVVTKTNELDITSNGNTIKLYEYRGKLRPPEAEGPPPILP